MLQDNDPESFDQQALNLLEKIKPVAVRDEIAANQGKKLFLSQAQALKPSTAQKPNQSPGKTSHRWFLGLNPILTILIVVLIVLGSSTSTVYAAQNSTPDQFLYPIKLASEDLQLNLVSNSTQSIGMNLAFSNRRLEEMTIMTDENKEVPESISSRWQLHIHDLFEHSQGYDDARMNQTMLQIQPELAQQLQNVDTLLVKHPGDPALLRLHSEILASQMLVKNGLTDPQSFRQKIQTSNGKEIENEIEEIENETLQPRNEEEDQHSIPVRTPTPTREDTLQPQNIPDEQVNTQQDEGSGEVETPQMTTSSSSESRSDDSGTQLTPVPNTHSETGDSSSSSENSRSSEHSEDESSEH